MRTSFRLSAAALLLAASPANAVVVNYAGSGAALPDLANVTSSINVVESFALKDVNVTVVGLQHSFWADLEITLSNGTSTIRLARQNGGSENPNGNFTFDDQAALPVTSINTTGGSFRPLDPLSTFNGALASGTWVLRIQDLAPLDSGAFQGWRISLSDTIGGAGDGSDGSDGVGAVPEPASWAMMILGFGAIGAAVRRRPAGATHAA